jgi:2-polyprenyl-6-methoxyphenol hydroxylase-like FAD-dependent oxidoreductase
MARQRALIVGGSVGGLFAAHLLRAHGWEVTVFERSGGTLADRGASIGTRPELFDVLRSIGIELDPSAGVAVTSRICLDRDGRIVAELPVRSINSAWDRIYRPLRAALPDELYRAAARVERIEQDADSVSAILADGTRESGALAIAADGINSTIRALLAPEATPRYAGYVAWRGVIEESEMSADEHALLFGRMCFALPQGELLLALGMPGRDADTRPGHRRYYWIWFRPAEEMNALPALCTDATGHCHGSSIPPHLVCEAVIRDLREAAESSAARGSLTRMAFSISRRRALSSAARCFLAIRLSSPGRMSAPASPKRHSTPSASSIRSPPNPILPSRSDATTASAAPSAARWWRGRAISAPISKPNPSNAAQASGAPKPCCANTARRERSRGDKLPFIIVMPAKAGIQSVAVDPRFRGGDGKGMRDRQT